jgi:hypothetical protein
MSAIAGSVRIDHRVLTAVLLIAGAVTVNVAFVGLGAAFDYPAVLNKEPTEVLGVFHDNQLVIGGWFLLLAAGAGLLAPIAIMVGRLSQDRRLRASVPIGIAAAVVQVVGLLRWPVVVPFLADRAADPEAASTFATLSLVLGTIIGETIGYALTATWTVLVALGLSGGVLGRVMTGLGLAAAALVATGILEPLGVPGTSLTNFFGYVLWSAWLVALAVIVLRRSRRAATSGRGSAH